MKLMEPLKIGPVTVKNRIFMAPLTRSRTEEPACVPNGLLVEHYSQRATAGMIVSEASPILKSAQGYAGSPGMYTDEQEDGWKKVTSAVKERGSVMSAQLWHVGRVSHADYHGGGKPVAPSAVLPADTRCSIIRNGELVYVQVETPRALETGEIRDIVKAYRSASERALRAGFDFVEEHAANGYLLQQFQVKSANKRTDAYGGSLEKRARLTVEVMDSMLEAVPAERFGIRISPYFNINGIDDDEHEAMALYLLRACEQRKIAYVSVAEPSWVGGIVLPEDFKKQIRQTYTGVIFYAGGYTGETAEAAVSSGICDAIAFGRPYIANPDLVERIRTGAKLNEVDRATVYRGGAKGYTDYPFLDRS